MSKLEELRLRYLNDPISVRLGGIAANLARVASFSKNDAHDKVVMTILQESKWFIEWTAAELNTEDIAELVKLQLQMAIWEIQSHNKWNDHLKCRWCYKNSITMGSYGLASRGAIFSRGVIFMYVRRFKFIFCLPAAKPNRYMQKGNYACKALEVEYSFGLYETDTFLI